MFKITGASKGIGYEYSKILLNKGYNLVAVAGNLENLKVEYPNQTIKTIDLDLSVMDNCYKLYDLTKSINFDLVINNAGFGGFLETNLEDELNMIDLNIKTLHILTKLYLKDYQDKIGFKILNVASMVAFQPGPLFSSYYASKSYVLNLSQAINYELKKQKHKARVITIFPGTLKTNFWQAANFNNQTLPVKPMSLEKFCFKSLNKALKTKHKDYVIIGFKNKLLKFLSKHSSDKMILKQVYKFQKQR